MATGALTPRLARALALSVCFLTVACSYRASPVERRASAPRYEPPAESSSRIRRPSHYTVQPGDTLYAIAWRYGLDYRDLARWNAISGSYTIYPGQAVRLYPRRQQAAPGTAITRPVVRDESQPAPVAVETAPAPSPDSPAANQPVRMPVAPDPAPATAPRPAAPAEAAPAASGPVRWQWPADGRVVAEYSSSVALRQGLDISANPGTPVKAAADGQVVYSGSGLAGYGELIIVKHSDRFLSAYAHNRARLVAEGETVKSGQKIAELGQTGTDRPKLHFQIRDNGRPVDPRKHLPRHRN
ncbi:MAG: peptidoglycan DD-metalloendopeptidase family protein [Pseudomonadota bacterium]